MTTEKDPPEPDERPTKREPRYGEGERVPKPKPAGVRLFLDGIEITESVPPEGIVSDSVFALPSQEEDEARRNREAWFGTPFGGPSYRIDEPLPRVPTGDQVQGYQRQLGGEGSPPGMTPPEVAAKVARMAEDAGVPSPSVEQIEEIIARIGQAHAEGTRGMCAEGVFARQVVRDGVTTSYRVRVDMTPGVTPEGEPYVGKVTHLEPVHVSQPRRRLPGDFGQFDQLAPTPKPAPRMYFASDFLPESVPWPGSEEAPALRNVDQAARALGSGDDGESDQ